MTIVEDPPARDDVLPVPDPLVLGRAQPTAPEAEAEERAPVRPVALAICWAAILVVSLVLVLVAVGPISEERDQRALLGSYRTEIESATNQAFGLGGIEVPTEAPTPGAPVAVLDIEGIQLSRVVVEGTEPAQTRQGPGHVVGTGGPGQPGNSVIVGRRSLFGGAFTELGAIEVGDRILVTTTQGRSVYEVDHVGTHTIIEPAPGDRAATTTTTSTTTTPPPVEGDPAVASAEDAAATPEPDDAAMLPEGALTVEQLYGPSPDDRLTLVTTASGTPGASGDALVVVATMDGQAFAPTPQGGRIAGADGRSGAPGLPAALVLALLAYVAAVAGAIWLNRNVPWRSAYLLSAPVLVALTIVLADELAGLLPAWS